MSPPSLRSAGGATRGAQTEAPAEARSETSASGESERSSEDTIRDLKARLRQAHAVIRQQKAGLSAPPPQGEDNVRLAQEQRRPHLEDEDAAAAAAMDNHQEGRAAEQTQAWVNQCSDPMARMAGAITEMATAIRSSHIGSPRPTVIDEEGKMTAMMARQSSYKDLPIFAGEPLEWPTFLSQYMHSTEMCRLSDSENLIRLQRALKGRARDVVNSLLLRSKNVQKIMATLERRFGSPVIIVSAMLATIRKLPRVQSDGTTESLLDLAGAVSNVVSTIEDLGEDYLTTPQLLIEIVNKLPLCTRIMWWSTRDEADGKATVQDFAAFLEKIAGVSAICGGAAAEVYSNPKINRKRDAQYVNTVTTSPDQKPQMPGKSNACVLCGRSHRLPTCRDYLNMTVEQRWDVVRGKQLCFVCLEDDHRAVKCTNTKTCDINRCSKLHHKTLHHASHDKRENRPAASAETQRRDANGSAPNASDNTASAGTSRPRDHGDRYRKEETVAHMWNGRTERDKPVLLKVIPIKITGPGGHRDIYALLDEGSTVTLLDAAVADMINAPGRTRGIRIRGAGGMSMTDDTSRRVEVTIQGKNGDAHVMRANTIKNLQLPTQPIHNGGNIKDVRPQLLIGQDNAALIVTRDATSKRGYISSTTILGEAVHGGSTHETRNYILATTVQDQDRLEQMVKENYAVDALGILPTLRVSREETRAAKIMEDTTHPLGSGKWETGLIWKEDSTRLPDNRTSALNRLIGIEKKMKKNDVFAEAYRTKMREYEEKGYAREASRTERQGPLGRRWYLPHFAVTNVNKPGKIRIVFDAASRYNGTSLNDTLLTGPDLLTSLLGNVIRFREGKIALAADIQEMFLQIKIRPEDQPAQMFLWRATPDEPLRDMVMTSMTFGASCSPSSAQYVRNKVADAHGYDAPAAKRAIQQKFYMDDYLDAVDSVKEGIALQQEVSKVLERGGFRLTNWASNAPALIKAIPEGLRAQGARKIIKEESATERILGIKWDPVTDDFQFKFETASETPYPERPTKREMLSAVMSIFDPLGFVGCLTIRPRILLQDVWRSKIGWDEEIKEEHVEKWHHWLKLLNETECTIPRQCVSLKTAPVELHVFCDSSEQAHCAVAYFVEGTTGGRTVTFIASKCRVTPLRALSIPRLELQAALIAARLATTIKKECNTKISRTIYWTDSMTVLCWIQSDTRTFTPFVAHRLGEIDELTQAHEWRWVPTKKNPADLGTRDGDAPDLSKYGTWFGGPEFLQSPEDAWPPIRGAVATAESSSEIKAAYCGNTAIMTSLPDEKRFSSWRRLVRTTAWVFRFIERCRMRHQDGGSTTLTVDELERAERTWIKLSQSDSYKTDVTSLEKGKPPARGGRLEKLTPHLDEHGIIRMGTRLLMAEGVAAAAKRPIILDGTHAYTRLLIRHFHLRGNHASTERTMSDIRESFFITRLRTAIREEIFRCQGCRNARCRPQPPLMGQLPPARLEHHVRPFTHCGVDMFGPMTVTIGRRREKRYGALFTCMGTRAVHIEITPSLSTDSLIQALRRMAARRGHPTHLYSDNGTNFRGADVEMAEAMRSLATDAHLQDEMTTRGINWNFNPPLSPHMGGAWERLIQSVKKTLMAILREQAPQEETLQTAIAEAEFTINTRPLTHISVNSADDPPLTPMHFLIGEPGSRVHLTDYRGIPPELCLKKKWRYAQRLADAFWCRWVREYLPTLAQRQKWHRITTPIAVGDLVVIQDAAFPRNVWPRGRVTAVNTAADGQVRSARVQTASGTYTRPAVKIAVLQIDKNVDPGEFPNEN